MQYFDHISATQADPLDQLHFREFADAMPHILWTAEPDGIVDYLNKVYTDYTGVTLDVASQSWLNALHPDDVERSVAIWSAAVATGNIYSVEFRVVHIASNEYRWHGVTARPVRDEHGAVRKWYGIATDIHERKIADERASLLAARLDTTIEGMADGFIMMDRHWRVVYVNRMAGKLMERQRSALLGKVIWEEYGELKESLVYRECHRAMEEQRPIEFEILSKIFDSWFEVNIYPSNDVLTIHFRDISGRKLAEAEIQRLAFYDQLTGLPNRQLLRDRLQHAMLVAKRTRRIGAVIFIDLDNFKALNDTQGHHKGDLLLQELAQRLSKCVREVDTVARLGGDEFVILLEELSSDGAAAAHHAELISEKILACVTEPFSLGDCHHTGTASIGVTLLDNESGGIEEVLMQADLAMYRAKAAGRNAIRFYDPEMQTTIAAKLALETAIRDSFQQNFFTLHYQPQLDRDGRIVGAEALVRWTHPAYRHVPPSVFIPLAEETGLIHPLGQWVLQEACARLRAWALEPATSQLTLAVNVSAHQFGHGDFVAEVLQTIRASGANPALLKLELTESALVNEIDDAVGKIAALKEHGVRFSLDDFGTGYSSLSYLRFLPFEQLKIDRSFINRIPGDSKDSSLVRAIIAMGHSLGLTVVAEGVETAEQCAFLARLGCDAYQGFLFCKPVDMGEFQRFLHAHVAASQNNDG